MGSTIRVNDTLQITAAQGFPAELDLVRQLESPLSALHFGGQTFSFRDKEGVRNFQQPPVLNFLVENRDGKHIYWGLIAMLNVTHDYLANVTSGIYRIDTLYTPEQMKVAAKLIGLDEKLDHFAAKRP